LESLTAGFEPLLGALPALRTVAFSVPAVCAAEYPGLAWVRAAALAACCWASARWQLAYASAAARHEPGLLLSSQLEYWQRAWLAVAVNMSAVLKVTDNKVENFIIAPENGCPR
jgi:hypothetical protein